MVLTIRGQEKIAQAQAESKQLKLKHIVVGDGNGSSVEKPTPSSVIVKERYAAEINEIAVADEASNQVVCKAVVPSEVGDFSIRELGIKDEDGELIAYGNFPETYKPMLNSGVKKELLLKVVIAVSSLESISLEVASEALASREYVDAIKVELNAKIDTKADKTYVDENLALKADKTYVDTKRDEIKSELESDLTQKADKTYVDTNYIAANEYISQVASNVLTKGELALESTTLTKNFAIKAYVGTGIAQDIQTGISSVDFTKKNNGSGFWLDRDSFEVKTDTDVVKESGEVKVNLSKVVIKSRSTTHSWRVFDSLRGSESSITHTTSTETTATGELTGFTSTGFSVGTHTGVNGNATTYICYQTLYTHVKWGVTNHNKKYVEVYNPITKDIMVIYKGSGAVGHEIPNALNTGLNYADFRNLETSGLAWLSFSSEGTSPSNGDFLSINGNEVLQTTLTRATNFNVNKTVIATSSNYNESNKEHILYGKAKSKTFTILNYVGTGTNGNFIETKDSNGVVRKPARVILRNISASSAWIVFDNIRGNVVQISLESNAAESNYPSPRFEFSNNGFILNGGTESYNTSGGSYLALVEFDTNGDGGESYFTMPADKSNLNLTSGVFNYTHGKSERGFLNSSESITGSIDFAGVSDGLKWVAKEKNGNYSFYDSKPSIGLYGKESASDNRVVFDTKTGKWFSTTGVELLTNTTFDVNVDNWMGISHNGSSYVSDNSVLTHNNNSAFLQNASGKTYSSMEQKITCEVGKTYVVKASVSSSINTHIIASKDSYLTGQQKDIIKSSNISLTDGSYTVEFTAPSTNVYIVFQLHSNVAGEWSRVDNVSVYKKEATLNSVHSTPLSFLKHPVMVTSETPQYIDYSQELEENIMKSLRVDGEISYQVPLFTGELPIHIKTVGTIFPWKTFIDTHNAMSGGIYEVPRDGYFCVSGNILINHTDSNRVPVSAYIYKNDEAIGYPYSYGNYHAQHHYVSFNVHVWCKKGDLIKLKTISANSSHYFNLGNHSIMNIKWVGDKK